MHAQRRTRTHAPLRPAATRRSAAPARGPAFAAHAFALGALLFTAPAFAADARLCAPGADEELCARTWPRVSAQLPYVDAARVDALLARMSLSDKVGQLIMAEIQHVTPDDLRRYRLGGILNGGGSYPGKNRAASAAEWRALADAYHDASLAEREGDDPRIPVLWGTDAVHGHNNVRGATLFPHNIGLGATRNPVLLREIGSATARELAATGLFWTFAPTLAVPQNLRWGRSYEGYSEDPQLVAELGAALVQGLADEGVLATAKHFIGDGGTHGGKDQGDTRVSEVELAAIHGAGYQSALAAGAQTVMASFNSWRGEKAHGSAYLLSEILKRRLGFDGFVVGDWNGHEQVPGCSKTDCPQALLAGVDMFMAPEDWKKLYRTTLKQARRGIIPRARLDDAVRRILRVKLRAGLFDARPSERRAQFLQGDDAAGVTDAEPQLGPPQHRALARRAARESLVLLKNERAVLPLRAGAGSKILVMGNAANEVARQTGGWSVTWQGRDTTNADFPGATTIYAGIKARARAAGGAAHFSADGAAPAWGDAPPDAVIWVFGETPYAEFEGDLKDLGFGSKDGGAEFEAARRFRAQGVPVAGVFLSGRPLDIKAELDATDAMVAAWLPGSEGAAVADLILRAEDGAAQYDFSGKLPYAWPADPAHATQADRARAPLYPFGYGLTLSAPGANAADE